MPFNIGYGELILLAAVALLLSRRATRKTKIAYAPYLAAGAMIALWGILG